jgi:hypothetical protein
MIHCNFLHRRRRRTASSRLGSLRWRGCQYGTGPHNARRPFGSRRSARVSPKRSMSDYGNRPKCTGMCNLTLRRYKHAARSNRASRAQMGPFSEGKASARHATQGDPIVKTSSGRRRRRICRQRAAATCRRAPEDGGRRCEQELDQDGS